MTDPSVPSPPGVPTAIEDTDRLPAIESSTGRAVVIALAVSLLGHAILIGAGMLRFDATSAAEPVADVIPVEIIPEQKKVEDQKPSRADDLKKEAETAAQPPAPAEANAAADAPPAKDASTPPAAASDDKTKLTASEIEAVRQQIQRCWKVPLGWSDPRQVSVVVAFGLTIDGKVTGQPAVSEFPANPLGVSAAKAAQGAVQQCSPYRLPAEKFSDWRNLQIRLTPGG